MWSKYCPAATGFSLQFIAPCALSLVSAAQDVILRDLLAVPGPRAIRRLLLADLAVLGVERLLAACSAPLRYPQDLSQKVVALHLGLPNMYNSREINTNEIIDEARALTNM